MFSACLNACIAELAAEFHHFLGEVRIPGAESCTHIADLGTIQKQFRTFGKPFFKTIDRRFLANDHTACALIDALFNWLHKSKFPLTLKKIVPVLKITVMP
jgi:hypothetical protein